MRLARFFRAASIYRAKEKGKKKMENKTCQQHGCHKFLLHDSRDKINMERAMRQSYTLPVVVKHSIIKSIFFNQFSEIDFQKLISLNQFLLNRFLIRKSISEN